MAGRKGASLNQAPRDGAPTSKARIRTALERRSDKRVIAVYRLAKLLSGREELCLVRNISVGGVKVEVFSAKTPGDDLAIDFGDDVPRPASVAWVDENFAGLSFSEPIDVGRTLAKAPRPGGRLARPIRLAVEVHATLTTQDGPSHCGLVDISQGGAKLRTDAKPEVGDRVYLELDGFGRLLGTVRWMRPGELGVSFANPIAYRDLAQWLGSNGSGPKPAETGS